jgi:hypothetical protein
MSLSKIFNPLAKDIGPDPTDRPSKRIGVLEGVLSAFQHPNFLACRCLRIKASGDIPQVRG